MEIPKKVQADGDKRRVLYRKKIDVYMEFAGEIKE